MTSAADREATTIPNPKDAYGVCKAPLSVVPSAPLLQIGLAMMEGGRKYGRHNYRKSNPIASIYYDALMRHMMAWWEGEDVDPSSGAPHLAHAGACIVILLDAINQGVIDDNRPPPSPAGWQQALAERAAAIVRKHPDCRAEVRAK